MYAITGITGQVGGATARALLAAGQAVRAIVRNAEKGRDWAALGCEVVVAEATDTAALTEAFRGADGVFFMTPPNYDPEPGFPGVKAITAAAMVAVEAVRPGRLVYLSTVGAQATEPNLLSNATAAEASLRALPIPTAFLRAAWFMENAAWDVAAARTGTVPSFLQPLDHPIPMVAAADIGQTAAELLGRSWSGTRVIELEGPERYAANDIAAGFADVLGHPVRMVPVPRETWEGLFRAQGMNNPMPRMRMLDGFNEGWIDFERGMTEHRRGMTSLDTVLRTLVHKSR
jgi:NAD(P)H dehydrogenase (quinone)